MTVQNSPESSRSGAACGAHTSRRTVLQGVAVAGAAAVAGPALSACDSSSGGSSSATGPSKPVTLGKAGDVPVGGGKVYGSQKVVVTQPTKGDLHAFSAICTHQGCTVGSVRDGLIECPCHGSKFSAEDGSVKAGPAPSPLPKLDLTDKNGTLVAGPHTSGGSAGPSASAS